jgi:hypothetical protein
MRGVGPHFADPANLKGVDTMLGNPATARQLSELMLDMGARLDASVALVRSTSTESEFIRYRNAAGGLMGAMLLEIMNPLYAAHPQLKPDALK